MTTKLSGEYARFAALLRSAARAEGVVVFVFGGVKGTGASFDAPPEVIDELPEVLEAIAEGIRAGLHKGPTH